MGKRKKAPQITREFFVGGQVAADTGKRKWYLVNSGDLKDQVLVFNSFSEMILAIIEFAPTPTRLVVERAGGSYPAEDWNEGIDLADASKNLILRVIDTNATKNERKRREHLGEPHGKTDIDDAHYIWHIANDDSSVYEVGRIRKRVLIPPTTVNEWIVRWRWYEYPYQKAWLKKNGLLITAATCQCVIASLFVALAGGNRKVLDKEAGLYALRKGSILSASFNRDTLPSMVIKRSSVKRKGKKVANMEDTVVRKECLRELRKLSRKIFAWVKRDLKAGVLVLELPKKPVHGVLPI